MSSPAMIVPISSQAMGLVLALLFALALMFYFVFWWMQRTDQAGYLGSVYRESVLEFEKSRRTQRVNDKRAQGEYLEDAVSSNAFRNERPQMPAILWDHIET